MYENIGVYSWLPGNTMGQYGAAGPTTAMQVSLDVRGYSERLMYYLHDSHFPGSQRVSSESRGGVIHFFCVARLIRTTPPRQ